MPVKTIDLRSDQAPAPDEYKKLMHRHGAVVLRNCPLDAEGMLNIASSLGTPANYNVKADNSMFGAGPVTYLKGERSESMRLSKDRLPLHNEGVVFKQKIDYLILYCYESGGVYPGDDTIICDQKRALRSLSNEQLNLLKKIKFEYLPDHKPFHDPVNDERRWVETEPVVFDRDGDTLLAIEFPCPDDMTTGWRVRVQGWSEAKSKRFLMDIEKHLRQDKYCYRHRWQRHDLMIVNNVTTLHAWHQLHRVGSRRLMRCHVAAKEQRQSWDLGPCTPCLKAIGMSLRHRALSQPFRFIMDPSPHIA